MKRRAKERKRSQRIDGTIYLRKGQRRDGALLAIRKYAGVKAGNPWLLSRFTSRGFILTHSSSRASGVRFAFRSGNPGELEFRVSGPTAALAVSLVVTAIVNTELTRIAEAVEVIAADSTE